MQTESATVVTVALDPPVIYDAPTTTTCVEQINGPGCGIVHEYPVPTTAPPTPVSLIPVPTSCSLDAPCQWGLPNPQQAVIDQWLADHATDTQEPVAEQQVVEVAEEPVLAYTGAETYVLGSLGLGLALAGVALRRFSRTVLARA